MSNTTALGRLIEAAARANHGRSMQQAADLATSRGATISKSLISESARGVKTITRTVIRGIALGYDISEEDVARAMLADLGFSISDYSPGAESAIRRDPDLSVEARGILLAAISAAYASDRVTAKESERAPNWGRGIRSGSAGEDSGVGRDKKRL